MALQAELEIEQAQSLGFEEYSTRWLEMIRTEPNRSGKKRAVGTVRSYQGKVTGYRGEVQSTAPCLVSMA